jgi:hypothetical protein
MAVMKPGERARSVACETKVVSVDASPRELDLPCGSAPVVAVVCASAPSLRSVAPFRPGNARRQALGERQRERREALHQTGQRAPLRGRCAMSVKAAKAPAVVGLKVSCTSA